MEEKNLVVQIDTTPALLFTEKGADAIIKAATEKVNEFKGSAETEDDRKETKKFVRTITKTRTFVEKLRLSEVSEMKAKAKLIDAEGKKMRDVFFLLEKEALEPVTKWEEAEKVRVEAEREYEKMLLDWDEAIEINIFEDKKADILRQEAELAKKQKDLREKEEKEQEEKDRIEREERLKREAAEKATKEAEQKLLDEKAESLRKENEAKEKLAQAERDRLATEERAEIEKEQAIKKIKDDAMAEQEKKDRKVAEDKAIADRKSANKNHQRRIHREIIEDLEKAGVKSDKATDILVAIVKKEIRNLYIKY